MELYLLACMAFQGMIQKERSQTRFISAQDYALCISFFFFPFFFEEGFFHAFASSITPHTQTHSEKKDLFYGSFGFLTVMLFSLYEALFSFSSIGFALTLFILDAPWKALELKCIRSARGELMPRTMAETGQQGENEKFFPKRRRTQ